jgi:hypothetical protein
LIAHKVDESGNFTPSGSMTACEYVVKRAISRGVSPRLTLAIWGEESGFSASTTWDGGAEDFGVISGSSARVANNITPQVDGFLNTVKNHEAEGYPAFLHRYSGESVAEPNFCVNRFFPYRVKDLYESIP